MSIPSSQYIPPPPLGVHTFVLYVCVPLSDREAKFCQSSSSSFAPRARQEAAQREEWPAVSEARRPLRSSLQPRAELASRSGWGSAPGPEPVTGLCVTALSTREGGEWVSASLSIFWESLWESLGESWALPEGGSQALPSLCVSSWRHPHTVDMLAVHRAEGPAQQVIACPQFTGKERERVIMVLLMCYRPVPVLHNRPVR